MLQPFLMSEVRLQSPYLANAFQKETDYLLSVDCDRLLCFFRKTRGLEPKAENYAGWENTEIRGHTMGHYLTALAQIYAASENSAAFTRLQYLMKELAECQYPNGYLSAFPEEFFDRVENRKPVWVPWYTMHKILAGLLSVYELCSLSLALQTAVKLGEWIYSRTTRWTPEIQANVLSVEYGGMNDCLYELYRLTKNEHFATAAHKFDEMELFTQLHNGQDVLNNRHANTTIPKFLGALNRYVAYGEKEPFYLETCEQFWEIVVLHHSYVTGGNSEAEHFGEPDILDKERTAQNCETCNTYNMLKLSRLLFQITGEKKYADFYERTLLNAILPSQNPETGMTMYFQPMATGYFKVYSKPFTDFWCCTGTGMENFSKLNDSLYFHDNDRLFVNLYLASSVHWQKKGITLEQSADIPNKSDAAFTVHTQQSADFFLCLRIPDWADGAELSVNHHFFAATEQNGYFIIHRIWENGDTAEIHFQIVPKCNSLPDNKNAVAFTYGPLVLSATLGKEQIEESNTGILVRVASRHIPIEDYLVCKGQTTEQWKHNICQNFTCIPGKLEFVLHNTEQDNKLVFSPYYRQYQQRYGIYWILLEENSPELTKHQAERRHTQALADAEIDSIQIGNDQYELSHKIHGFETESGDREGYHYRVAKLDGWFSYEMQIASGRPALLQFQYIPGNCKNGFRVFVNDILLAQVDVKTALPHQATSCIFPLPEKLLQQNAVTVKFCAPERGESAWIVNVLRIISNDSPSKDSN